MKWVLAFIFAGAALLAPRCWAGNEFIEAPIYRHAAPVAVSISTSAYTKVPTATKLLNRTILLIDNPSTNTGIVHGHVGNCTSTAISISAVKGPIEISPSANGAMVALGPDECLWIVSRHTSAESITAQELSQRYGP